VVRLSRNDEPLDRDFVLRWRLAQDDVRPSLVSVRHTDGRTYSLLSLLAPRAAGTAAKPRDVVFVLDRSGSMSGKKMASAARACAVLLRTLGPADRFAALAFDEAVEWYSGAAALFAADEDGLARGERWLRGIDARGGTEIERALSHALDFLQKREGGAVRTAAVVLVTDGEVGNEGAVLKRVRQSAGATRLFVVGVDTAVNSGLLRELARAGGGTAAFVEPGTALEGALAAIGRDIGEPLVTDIALEGADGTKIDDASLAPSRIGDLFGGGSTSVAFRAAAPGPVRVRGRRPDGSPFDAVVQGHELPLPAIAHVWARERLTDLEDRFRMDERQHDALRQEIVDTSIAYGVLCRFTAFVAVDKSDVIASPSERRKVVQPVHEPAGWEMSAALGVVAPAMMSHRAVGLPYAADADLVFASEAAPAARGGLESSLVGWLHSGAPVGAAWMTREIGALRRLVRDLGHAYVDVPAGPAVEVDRVREVRDRLLAVVDSVPDRVAEWLRDLVDVLDRLVRLLAGPGVAPDDVKEAVEKLQSLTSLPSPASPTTRPRRFWEL
jgi:Ca-activated chloride channel family protein